MTPAQKKVFVAIVATIAETGNEYVSQGPVSLHLGKLPHPNTVDSLVRAGHLVKNPNVSWSEYKPAEK